MGATYDDTIGSVAGWQSDCTDETTAADQVACWSASDSTLDLVAPGANITSTRIGGGAITFRGTSQASPHAAGVAALLYQAFPDITVDELEARMKSAGTLVTDELDDDDTSTNRTTPRVDARVALLELDEDTRAKALADLKAFATKAHKHAKEQGYSDEEIDAAIDQTAADMRRRKRL